MSRPDKVRCSSHVQFHVVSLLIPLVFPHLFSRTVGAQSHQNVSRHRSPQNPLKSLWGLITLCSLSSSQRQTQLSTQLNFYVVRIPKIENASYSACDYSSQDASHPILRVNCPVTDSLSGSLFGDFFSLSHLKCRLLGSIPASGTPWCLPCPHFSEGVGKNNK